MATTLALGDTDVLTILDDYRAIMPKLEKAVRDAASPESFDADSP